MEEAEYASEPEELLEAKLTALLRSVCTIPVYGAIEYADVGTEKRVTSDTFIGVSVDVANQDGDYVFKAPFTYTARVTVNFALADDATGKGFRDECRRVRHVLMSLIGDRCNAFNSAEFQCDQFIMDNTNTTFDGGDNPVNTKAYSATLKGRQLTTEAN